VKTLVAGVGSPILTDDGVGFHLARRLEKLPLPADVDVLALGTAGLDLMEFARGYERLIVVDAIVTGAKPGKIFELSGDNLDRAVHATSSHEADLSTSLAFCRKLLGKEMPTEVVLIAVEASDLKTFSEQLTPEVEEALGDVLDRVMKRLT
jgi:hydrogenase maturation protease